MERAGGRQACMDKCAKKEVCVTGLGDVAPRRWWDGVICALWAPPAINAINISSRIYLGIMPCLALLARTAYAHCPAACHCAPHAAPAASHARCARARTRCTPAPTAPPTSTPLPRAPTYLLPARVTQHDNALARTRFILPPFTATCLLWQSCMPAPLPRLLRRCTPRKT